MNNIVRFAGLAGHSVRSLFDGIADNHGTLHQDGTIIGTRSPALVYCQQLLLILTLQGKL